MSTKPKVFFDGGCPLCKREIEHYRRIDTEGSLEWIDISSDPQKLHSYHIQPDQALQILHGVNEKDRIVKGVDTFLLIWSNLPHYRNLAGLIEKLKLHKLLEYFYQLFAQWRFKKRCGNTGKCSL